MAYIKVNNEVITNHTRILRLKTILPTFFTSNDVQGNDLVEETIPTLFDQITNNLLTIISSVVTSAASTSNKKL